MESDPHRAPDHGSGAPFVPIFNLACCVIAMIGAVVAVATYRNSSPPPALTHNDRVVLGIMSGLVGAVIYSLILIPLVVFIGSTVGGFAGRILQDRLERR